MIAGDFGVASKYSRKLLNMLITNRMLGLFLARRILAFPAFIVDSQSYKLARAISKVGEHVSLNL
jgi:hypothetical protein